MPTSEDNHLDLRSLARLGGWGAAALTAAAIAVFAANTNMDGRRLTLAVAPAPPNPQPTDAIAAARAGMIEAENRRLSETVRGLSADRDQLLARIAVIERNLEDVTGSIKHPTPPRAAPAEPAPRPAPQVSAPQSGPTLTSTIAALLLLGQPGNATAQPQVWSENIFADPQVTASVGTRTEFGVDLGGGRNIGALRELWSVARAHHADLGRLQPVVAAHDHKGGVELRLIAGPLANAAAAARLCASLASSGWACRQAVYDGQRLPVR